MSEPSHRTAPVDLVIVLTFLTVLNVALFQVTWVYAGPITAVSTVVLATVLLRWRGLSWANLGLRKPNRVWVTLLLSVVVFVGTAFVLYGAHQLVGVYFEEPETTSTRFGNIEGNFLLFSWWVAISWIVGGFCEEMLFRGFLLNRLETAIGLARVGTGLAVLVQAALFGMIHYYYQGAFGALTMIAAATFWGICYIALGRNLWPLILSHGTLNTLGFVGEYLGG